MGALINFQTEALREDCGSDHPCRTSHAEKARYSATRGLEVEPDIRLPDDDTAAESAQEREEQGARAASSG